MFCILSFLYNMQIFLFYSIGYSILRCRICDICYVDYVDREPLQHSTKQQHMYFNFLTVKIEYNIRFRYTLHSENEGMVLQKLDNVKKLLPIL